MIELKINGINIAVPPGVQMTRDFESTIFNRETDVIDFNYPVDLPLTDDTIRAFGFPNSLANPNLKQIIQAEYYESGNYIALVTASIQKISLSTKVISIAIIGQYGSFALLLNGRGVNSLALGGVRTVGVIGSAGTVPIVMTPDYGLFYAKCTTKNHVRDVNTGAVVTDYVFGQAIDQSASNTNVQGNAISLFNPFSYQTFGGSINEWTDTQYINCLKTLPGQSQIVDNDVLYWWSPQFRLSFVLRKCFEDTGFTVSGSLFSDPKFNSIVLYNTFVINRCDVSYDVNATSGLGELRITDRSIYINPGDHMPAMTVIDFITEIGKNYNLVYDIDFRDYTAVVRQLDTPNTSGPVLDITNMVDPNPDISFVDQDFNLGYEFAFSPDPNDLAQGGANDNNAMSYNFLGSFTTTEQAGLVTTPALDDMVYIYGENAYYKYDGVEYSFFAHNLGKVNTTGNTGAAQINSKAMPMPMAFGTVSKSQVASSGIAYLPTDHEIMPFSNIGLQGRDLFVYDKTKMLTTGSTAQKMINCFSTYTTVAIPTQPHPVNWLGMQQIKNASSAGYIYPLISSTRYNASGFGLTAQMQAWTSPVNNGLYDVYWTNFVQALANAVAVEYQMLIDALTYNNVNWNNTVFVIEGLQYLCQKANFVTPLPAISDVTLVRIQ